MPFKKINKKKATNYENKVFLSLLEIVLKVLPVWMSINVVHMVDDYFLPYIHVMKNCVSRSL